MRSAFGNVMPKAFAPKDSYLFPAKFPGTKVAKPVMLPLGCESASKGKH
jgi:hypothetical protein